VRRDLLLLLGALLASVLCAKAAAPAWAHTRLVSSTPAQDVPAAAPREVTLVFSDPVQPALSTVSVRGADGEDLVAGQPSSTGNGTSVVQALRSPLGPGTYTVAYRVLAADGHPVTGSFQITATAPAVDAPAPSTTAEAPAPTSTPGTPETPALQAVADEDDDGGLPVLPLLAGGLVVAGAAGLLARRLGAAPPTP
jgi:methionine-rich copper-binding protein CopC